MLQILINIDVPELESAIRFYSRALDLKHSRTLDNDVAELSGASATIYLLKTAAGSSTSSTGIDTRCYSRHWTPVHMDFVVDEIEAASRRAVEAGAVQESDCQQWRGSKCITFSDPFGHGFCLIEFAGDGYN